MPGARRLRHTAGGAVSEGLLRGLVLWLGRDLRPGLVAAASLPDGRQQGAQFLALSRLEAFHQLGLHAVHHLGDLVDHREALLRDLHEVPAAILRIAASLRVAPLLELVEDGDEVGGIQVQLATQSLLRELAAVAQFDQGRDVARADAERLERLCEAVHRDPAQLDHQEGGPSLGDAGGRGLFRVLWHAQNVTTHEPLVNTNDLLRYCNLPASRQVEPPDDPHGPLPRGISYALLQSLVVPALPEIQNSLHTSESAVA